MTPSVPSVQEQIQSTLTGHLTDTVQVNMSADLGAWNSCVLEHLVLGGLTLVLIFLAACNNNSMKQQCVWVFQVLLNTQPSYTGLRDSFRCIMS